MTYANIQYTVDDPVATLTLDRPDVLNALTYEMLGEIRDATRAAMADPAVVGLVITGNGRGFCSGLDASVLAQTTDAGSSARDDGADGELPGMFTYLLEQPKPVIAAVNGVAAGGGFVLAAMCDLRFASSTAAFTTIFSKRGLIAEHGTTWILPRLLGTGRALDLLWSSRKIDATEAARLGLVEDVTDPADLLIRAREYITELAANVSPASLRDTKRLVYRHVSQGYPEALKEADDATWAALDREDATEGAAALIERRPPNFPRVTGA